MKEFHVQLSGCVYWHLYDDISANTKEEALAVAKDRFRNNEFQQMDAKDQINLDKWRVGGIKDTILDDDVLLAYHVYEIDREQERKWGFGG